MITYKNEKLAIELPWEMVELIVRDALKTDVLYAGSHPDDAEVRAAIRLVYQYYGGDLNEIPSN